MITTVDDALKARPIISPVAWRWAKEIVAPLL